MMSRQGGNHYIFEELKASASPEGPGSSADDWIECLKKARDLAMSTNATSQGSDDAFAEIPSAVSSPASILGTRDNYAEVFGLNERAPRNHLSKSQGSVDDNGPKRNRFSKRQSRSGPGPAF